MSLSELSSCICGYKQALQQFRCRRDISSFKILYNILETLIPQLFSFVPGTIMACEFRDIIAELATDILSFEDEWGNMLIHKFAEDGNIIGLCAVLDVKGKNYRDVINRDGNTPLHVAAINNHSQCIIALLKGSDPEYREIPCKEGRTALHLAAEDGNIACVRALLDEASPEYREVTDEYDYTPLHDASCNGYSDCVEVLLENCRPDYDKMLSYDGYRAVQVTTNVDVISVFLRSKYNKIISPIISTNLFVTDEKSMFWSNDSIVKDTVKWIIGEEHFDDLKHGLYSFH
eukprot:TRINITY_DN1362_c0_g2_i2.p1 TRINITY_DN1362_c0_g2~~TRINITY_DN1362_c0_g2_i2.p1  ORF type:complete len:289 (-),score=42.94 TRINITY_DN1362_c0_g2_i2:144-1010(-)